MFILILYVPDSAPYNTDYVILTYIILYEPTKQQLYQPALILLLSLSVGLHQALRKTPLCGIFTIFHKLVCCNCKLHL